jgi:hypothetical protein
LDRPFRPSVTESAASTPDLKVGKERVGYR